MLGGGDAFFGHRFALHQLRQARFFFVFIIAAFVIHLQKPVKQHHLARGAQNDLPILAGQIHRRAFQPRAGHLAGKRAFPNQIIQAALIAVGNAQIALGHIHIGGANALMRFLGVLGFVFVNTRLIGHIVCAKARRNRAARRRHRFGGHINAVGAHIGDMPRLIQALRRRHTGLGPHAKFARCLLLQSAGHKRRIGVACGGLGLHALHAQIARAHRRCRQIGSLCGGNIKLVQLFACKLRQLGAKCLAARRGEQRGHRPKLARTKRLDLHLAFHHKTQAHRLHPPRAARSGQFAPQHGREVKPHQIIQRAARKIGIHQRLIHLARMAHRFGHGLFGDGVKRHARNGFALFQARLQRLLQMPRNRLALAVGVGGQNQMVIAFQRLGNGAHMLFAIGPHFPQHIKIIARIHRPILGRQIAHMAETGQNCIVWPQIFVDGLGLGRGFYYNDRHMIP